MKFFITQYDTVTSIVIYVGQFHHGAGPWVGGGHGIFFHYLYQFFRYPTVRYKWVPFLFGVLVAGSALRWQIVL